MLGLELWREPGRDRVVAAESFGTKCEEQLYVFVFCPGPRLARLSCVRG